MLFYFVIFIFNLKYFSQQTTIEQFCLLIIFKYSLISEFPLNPENFVQIHTKTFGGKIWNNLHRVSLDNIFDKKILTFSAKRYGNIPLCKNFPQEKISNIPFSLKKKKIPRRLFSEVCFLNFFFLHKVISTLKYTNNKQHGHL